MSGNKEVERSSRLSATVRTVDGVRVVTLRGEIDHTAREVLGQALAPEGAAPAPRVVADLTGVGFMDSSGINVFITAHRRIGEIGGQLLLAGAGEAVRRVLALVGVDTVIPCHPTLAQALRA
ncbi:STAS domain-containing protein [Streptomyces sp. WAC08241]|uniref:STAS domain-containing protein n=1 Tax=Streptomyces sp. WAC08241 TaxID=2487421 RepID=UPI000F7A8156|nr:STAS domain-containing protein [Streptomyces sp. WAC08241]RSS47128.1 anti-sigma factor antagonist [Streptomyces sp. WAC08241]